MNAKAPFSFFLSAQDRLLLSVVQDVLTAWTTLTAHSIAKPPELPGMLALEMRLTFFGEREGRLVLRTSTQFGRRLVEATLGEMDADEEAARDALGELCNLVGKHLASRSFAGEGARIQSSVPETSTPLDWPASVAAQSVAMKIGEETLEARLWMWKPAQVRERGS